MSLVDLARLLGTTTGEQTEPTSRHVAANSLNVRILEWGRAGRQGVMLCHAAEETAHSWDLVGLAFADDYHVVAPDCRGYGASDREPDGAYGRGWDVLDMEQIAHATGLQDFVLVGQARGGRNACLFAVKHPERVRALVLIDTAPDLGTMAVTSVLAYLDELHGVGSYEEFVQRLHAHNPLRPVEQVRTMLAHQVRQMPDGEWTWDWDARTFASKRDTQPASGAESLWPKLQDIRCPTLLVRGAMSTIMTADIASRMTASIPGARLETIEKAGHLVAGDNPAAFERVLRTFLAAVRAR